MRISNPYNNRANIVDAAYVALRKLNKARGYHFSIHNEEGLSCIDLVNSKNDMTVAHIEVETGNAFNGFHLYFINDENESMLLHSHNLGDRAKLEYYATVAERHGFDIDGLTENTPASLKTDRRMENWLVNTMVKRILRFKKAAPFLMKLQQDVNSDMHTNTLLEIERVFGVVFSNHVFMQFEPVDYAPAAKLVYPDIVELFADVTRVWDGEERDPKVGTVVREFDGGVIAQYEAIPEPAPEVIKEKKMPSKIYGVQDLDYLADVFDQFCTPSLARLIDYAHGRYSFTIDEHAMDIPGPVRRNAFITAILGMEEIQDLMDDILNDEIEIERVEQKAIQKYLRK